MLFFVLRRRRWHFIRWLRFKRGVFSKFRERIAPRYILSPLSGRAGNVSHQHPAIRQSGISIPRLTVPPFSFPMSLGSPVAALRFRLPSYFPTPRGFLLLSSFSCRHRHRHRPPSLLLVPERIELLLLTDLILRLSNSSWHVDR